LDGASVVDILEAGTHALSRGVVCYAAVADNSRAVKRLLNQAAEYSAIVFYGCSDEEIEVEFLDQPIKELKKCRGICRAWRKKQICGVSIELPKSSILDLENEEGMTTAEFGESIEKMKQLAQAAAPDPSGQEARPGILVFFPGIPGCGKSTLCESVGEELQGRLASKSKDGGDLEQVTRKVHVSMGDNLGKSFWSNAKKVREKDPSCVFIADKNTPPPSWKVVGSTCSETSGVPVAVFPDRAALQTTAVKGAFKPDGTLSTDVSHFYPFSLTYLAVCMARVLEREPSSHQGKLDKGTPIACMIVVMFFSLYRNISAEDFECTIRSRLKQEAPTSMRPIELRFFEGTHTKCLAPDLIEALVDALRLQVSCQI
jgi:hypothetical protein